MQKILIIEEAGEHTGSTVTFLRDSGYDVQEADNVFLAAAFLRKAKFDLILCSQKLFTDETSPLQEIIFEDSRHSQIILLRQIGEDPIAQPHRRIIGYIDKPIDPEKLLGVISSKVHQSGFTGMVNDIDITDYLQLLAMNKKTKAFVVEGENGKGVIVLHKGQVIYAAFGELRGDLAFHALLALKNGKIIDKKLKRLPQQNIRKSLTQLLLEGATNSDESATGNSRGGDFLAEEQQSAGSDGGPEKDISGDVLLGQSKGGVPTYVTISLILLFTLVGGMAWKLFSMDSSSQEQVASKPQLVTPTAVDVTLSSTSHSLRHESADPHSALPSASIREQPTSSKQQENIQTDMISTAEPEKRPPAGQLETDTEKHERVPVAESAPVVDILFRLHGSNTIGAKLAENLVTDYLIHKMNAKNIATIQGEKPVERVITGETEQGLVGVEIHAHGSSTGFQDLKAGVCDIGMASRKIKDKEVEGLISLGDMTASASEHILALDGIAVIVNKRNPIRSLTIDKIAAIFSGEIKDWRDVSDGRFSGPINVYARDNKSGTYDTFKGIVLKKTPLTGLARRFESNAELSDNVSKDKLGIGFTGLPYIRQSKALAVSDQGTTPVYPNFFTVATEDYLLARRLYLYLPANNENVVAADFIDYSLTRSGQAVVSDTGFVDLNIRPFAANIDTDGLQVQDTLVFQHYVEETKDKKRLSLNFRFRKDSIELDNRALRDLDRMVEFLKNEAIESVSLIGFADSRGDYHYNTSLALERSKVVRNELKSRGIPISSVISASEEMPVSSNITSRGREKNRRVEVWVRLNKA